MDILIISGFLGAGKTTFIKALAKHTKKEIAILENEYGDVGIDGDILKKQTSGGEVNIWEMTEGCICCSTKRDFASSVLTIANSIDPECLVIEPTGVGFLSKILANLQQIEYEKIRLLAPITIIDGHSYMRYVQEYSVLYQDHVASASIIFVSKMEQATSDEKGQIMAELKKINPKGRIITEHYSLMNQSEWNRLFEVGYDGILLKPKKETELLDIDTFSLADAIVSSPEQLLLMLEDLIRGKYGNIIRAKGQIEARGQKFRFDVSDGQYIVSGADSELENKAIFIGKNIQRQKLRRNFFEKIKYIPTTNR